VTGQPTVTEDAETFCPRVGAWLVARTGLDIGKDTNAKSTDRLGICLSRRKMSEFMPATGGRAAFWRD